MTDKEIGFIFNISIFILLALVILFGISYIVSSIKDSTNVYGAWGSLEMKWWKIPETHRFIKKCVDYSYLFCNYQFF